MLTVLTSGAHALFSFSRLGLRVKGCYLSVVVFFYIWIWEFWRKHELRALRLRFPACWSWPERFGFKTTWRPRGLSKSVISRVIMRVTPFRVLITLLITHLLSPLGLQIGVHQASSDFRNAWRLATPTLKSSPPTAFASIRYLLHDPRPRFRV